MAKVNLKPKASFIVRLKLAWYAFTLQNKSIQTHPFEYYCELKPNSGVCDNISRTGCTNEAEVALSEGRATIEYRETDFYHLCNDCAPKMKGKSKKLPRKF